MKLLSFQKLLFFIKPCIFCDLEQQHSKTRNLFKKQLILSRTKNLRKFQNSSLCLCCHLKWFVQRHHKNKRIAGSLCHLTSLDKAKSGTRKPGVDYLLECFLPTSFSWSINISPKKFQEFLKLGMHPPPDPHQYAYASLKDTPQTVTN